MSDPVPLPLIDLVGNVTLVSLRLIVRAANPLQVKYAADSPQSSVNENLELLDGCPIDDFFICRVLWKNKDWI